ncbi:carotenoid 1,2-hydratase [Vibrio astriarenae]|uniref:Carotenoid 1,2-hydratase n=1 Tax=Vibrio astriarenae TaxID=1481923 RepID=A0A7Z2T5T1_9VIBR|nr:lipocalin-like domain-containing protein [Vibrio astriarenae]QIA64948.1 carotenoid 1,2-hydratase [Vibrio astriarenae]
MRILALVLPIILSSIVLSGCEEHQPSGMGTLLGGSESQSEDPLFAQVTEGNPITFPKDHQAHPTYRHEWWYLTANLEDDQGNPLGIQWTQFRFAAAPESPDQEQNTIWQTRQIYMAHSAVTTETIHYADEKWSRDQAELAGVGASPFRVYIDDWQWTSKGEDLFPATLTTQSEQFSYSLKLTSHASYQKQGEQGYSEKSADGQVASYYYSQPFIEVSGEVTIDGVTRRVTGQGWIDREWSSQFLLDTQQGWDWFALRLDEETSLVVFQLRDTETGKSNYSYARLMRSDGSGLNMKHEDVSLVAVENTDIEGRDYPTQWIIQIPSQQIDVSISALNPKAKMPLSVPYWEGPVVIDGTHQGLGYMELTGY